MLKLITVNGQRVDRPPYARPSAAPYTPEAIPSAVLWAPLAAFGLWWRCALMLLPSSPTASLREGSAMTDSSGASHPDHVVQSPFGKSMTLHLLRMLEADLQAVDSPAGELDAVQCMGLVLSSVGCITNDACLDMNELVKERRKAGAAANDLIDAVLLFRPVGWGYCTWNDTLGGRGYCAHIYPPAVPRRDSEVPSVIGAFSELMATARAIVKAWVYITGEQQ